MKIINIDEYRNRQTGILDFGGLIRDYSNYYRIEMSDDMPYVWDFETIEFFSYPIYERNNNDLENRDDVVR